MAVEKHGQSGHSYVLGHSQFELDRLATQARLVGPITRRCFVNAGLKPGMRVLDVGCGAGDVSYLAADVVGKSGEVVGVDRVLAAVETATARAEMMSLSNVSFRAGDLSEMKFQKPFDAAVGRFVLEFQPEPATLLRAVVAHVRPGGIVVFQEPDWNGATSTPPSPVFDQCCRWFADMLIRSGANPRMGVRLHSTFVAAGLPGPSMHGESLMGGGSEAADIVRFKSDLIRTIAPQLAQAGMATASEIGLESLAQRMLDDVITRRSVLTSVMLVGAWSRKP